MHPPSGIRQRAGLAGAAAALAAIVLLSSCASRWDGRVFRDGDLAFRVGPTPASWREIETPGALLSFRDDDAGATVAISGRCGKDGDDVPLVSLTHHLFIHFTDRELESQETVTLDGRDALRTELVAELDGVPKRFSVFVLKKDGCVYDFMHIAASSAPEHGRERFAAFVEGFATLE